MNHSLTQTMCADDARRAFDFHILTMRTAGVAPRGTLSTGPAFLPILSLDMTRIITCPFPLSLTRTLRMTLIGAVALCCLPCLPAQADNACPDAAAAQRGDAAAQYLTGKAYDDGTCGLETDKQQALHWYALAARQGNMLAEYEMGETYFAGDGVPTDYPKAKTWFLKAARQGHGPSALRLGFLCAEAHYKGVTVDDAAAEHWFTVAALQDTGDARFRLGTFYMDYKHPPDYARGRHWLTLAAQGGHTLAMFDLGRFLLAPPAAAGMAPETATGLDWITKAAEGGLLPAQMTLADMYEKGRNAPHDAAKAFKWIMRIAGEPTASTYYLNRAGDILFTGWESVPKNYPAARRFYERAALREDAHALQRLSDIYTQGLGVEKAPAKAAAYAARAKAASPR